MSEKAKFQIGQAVEHRLFGYRGVIFDVDATFQLSEEWYETVARSRPPKNKPWYHVLVHDATHVTYVAERNLATDDSGLPVRHPAIDEVFDAFEEGRYYRRRSVN